MRRKDREVTDTKKIREIIRRCTCCRIGFYDNHEVYIVPLSFGYEIKEDVCVLYFHGAEEGRKMELIQTSPEVGFEMDTGYALQEAHAACGYSVRFQSVIGNGILKMVTDYEEKKRALSLLMEHYTGKKEWDFQEKMVRAAAVFQLKVTKMSCKEHP